jgi:hypothetical protein
MLGSKGAIDAYNAFGSADVVVDIVGCYGYVFRRKPLGLNVNMNFSLLRSVSNR